MKSKVALTDQQAEVLRLTKADIRPRQIAALLGISTQRVYQHLERLSQLGVLKGRKR